MKKYFKVVGKKQTLELNITEGSPASIASTEELSKSLKCDLREIDKIEYKKLTIQFTR